MKQLMKGNEAVVHGALLGGATHFFGYPITPASEIAHAAAELFPKSGRCFLQAESEVAAVNMIYGASAAGARSLTASSGPGISLMAEGLSYLAGAELPAVVVDIQRAGPGLGNIWPEQSDYDLVVKGCGHGNHRNIVLAPQSAQELCDFTCRAFELAERHRMTVFILADACVGQMMEPVEIPAVVSHGGRLHWALYGDAASRGNLVSSIYMSTAAQSAHVRKLLDKYRSLEEMAEWRESATEDAELLLVAFGICARVALSAVRQLRARGVKAGLFRPTTLFPFPAKRLAELGAGPVKRVAVVELNRGMMACDVAQALPDRVEQRKLGWLGGEVPGAADLLGRLAAEFPDLAGLAGH